MLRVANLIKFNADVTEADRKRLDEQGMMIEHTGVDQALSNPEPRVIKTHFDYKNIPVTFRQDKGKVRHFWRIQTIVFFERLGGRDFYDSFNQYITFFTKHYEYKTRSLDNYIFTCQAAWEIQMKYFFFSRLYIFAEMPKMCSCLFTISLKASQI